MFCVKVEFLTKIDQSTPIQQGQGRIMPIRGEVPSSQLENLDEFKSEGEVECFSLELMVKAVGQSQIDVLVLDVQGQEYNVLKTYPYRSLPIKMIAVKHNLTGKSDELKILLGSNGYRLVYESETDFIFLLS